MMNSPLTSRGAASIAAPQPSRNPATSDASVTSWANPIRPTRAASNSKAVATPKFAPAPRIAPEQLRLVVRGRAVERTVGGDDLDRAEPVDGEPVPPREPADAAGRREPADPDSAVVAGGDREAVRGERPRDLEPRRARSDADESALGVEELDRVERGEVDDEPAVVRRAPAHAMAGAADAERQIAMAGGEGDGIPHAVHVGGPEDEAGRATAEVVRGGGPVAEVAGLDRGRAE